MDLNWAAVSALCLVATIAGAAGVKVYGRAFGEGRAASRSGALETLLAAAVGKLDLLYGAFAEHKVDDARNFAKLEAMGSETSRAAVAAENRIAAAIDGFSRELSKMTDRIDRLLENRS